MIQLKKSTYDNLLDNKNNEKKCNMVLHNYFKKVYKKSMEEYLSEFKQINKCGFCDNFSYIKSCDITFLDEFNIDINNIEYFYPHKCRNLDKNCTAKNYNPNSVEFVMRCYAFNKNEALDYIHNRNRSPFYKNNFSSEEEYKKSQTRDEEFFIKKYGVNGKNKYNKFKENHKYSYTEKAYVDKYGIDGIEIKKSIDKSKALTKEKLGEEKWIAWKNKWNNKKSDFINKYGKEIGLKKYEEFINLKRYQNSLQYYIDKYGEKKGTIEWKEKNKRCAITEEKLGKKNIMNGRKKYQ